MLGVLWHTLHTVTLHSFLLHVDSHSKWTLANSDGVTEVIPLCPTLFNPIDCSLPGYSFHGIFQSRILEWVVTSFSRGSSWPRHRTRVFCIAGRFFTTEPPGKPQKLNNTLLNNQWVTEEITKEIRKQFEINENNSIMYYNLRDAVKAF